MVDWRSTSIILIWWAGSWEISEEASNDKTITGTIPRYWGGWLQNILYGDRSWLLISETKKCARENLTSMYVCSGIFQRKFSCSWGQWHQDKAPEVNHVLDHERFQEQTWKLKLRKVTPLEETAFLMPPFSSLALNDGGNMHYLIPTYIHTCMWFVVGRVLRRMAAMSTTLALSTLAIASTSATALPNGT